MPGPLDEELTFFRECSGSRDDMLSAMERRFSADSRSENVGMATAVGIDQARQFVEGPILSPGVTISTQAAFKGGWG